MYLVKWTASSEFGNYRICEQQSFRRACASAQSRQNLSCSLIRAVSQEEPSDRKPDPRPLWMAGRAQLKFVMTECSKTQIRLMGLKSYRKSRATSSALPQWGDYNAENWLHSYENMVSRKTNKDINRKIPWSKESFLGCLNCISFLYFLLPAAIYIYTRYNFIRKMNTSVFP